MSYGADIEKSASPTYGKVNPKDHPYKSFRWNLTEFEIVNETLNKVKFKATVLKPGLSKNGKMYLTDEIVEAGRTLSQKAINVNHNNQKVIGNTDWASPNKQTHALEVSGTINKQPYVNMIKMHDPKITGWSVQADCLTGECIHCHKEFKTMEALKDHMINEEHLQNMTFAPRGILFNALALVESPEVPGVASATGYEITETEKFGTLEEFCDIVSQGEEMEPKIVEKEQLMTDAAVTKELKVATEHLNRLESGLDGLVERYNTAGLAVNKWKQDVDVKVAETLRIISEGTAEIARLKESIPERKEMLKLIESQQITLENTRDKLKGVFKGKQKDVIPKEGSGMLTDPVTGKVYG